MPDTEATETSLALHEEAISRHDEAIKRINERIDAMHDWQVALNAQLSMWRWFAPLLASVVSSIVTAFILGSMMP